MGTHNADGGIRAKSVSSQLATAGVFRDSTVMSRRRCRRYLVLTPLCTAAALCLLLLDLRNHADSKYKKAPELELTSLSVLDASQKYRVRQFVAVGERWQQLSAGNLSTCLALHVSLSHMHHVELQARSWSGSVSAAVFAAGDDLHLLLAYLTFLRRCRQHVRDRVSFHILWPVDQPPNDTVGATRDWLGETQPDCSEDAEHVMQRLLDLQTRPVGASLSYPQNLARNTARLACATRLTLCPDADMLPAPGMDLAARLQDLFSRQPPCDKCAYVLPVFEVDTSVASLPENKWELRQLVVENKARPFHWQLFRPNQKALKPWRWLWNGSDWSPQMSVAYETDYLWGFEPVYVATSGELPLFDETFVGYGFTRNTQAYEMFVSGWRFFTLDHAFLMHWGLQTLRTQPKWRRREMAVNYRRFRKWTSQVSLKYDRDPLKLLRTHADLASSMTTCPRKLCRRELPTPTNSTETE